MPLPVISTDVFLEAAKGRFPYPVGRNNTTLVNPPKGQTVSAWELLTPYNFRPTPAQVSVVSTSPNDAAGGTGVRSVFIFGRDPVTHIWNIMPIVLTLNGTTPVLSSVNFDTIDSGLEAFEVGVLGGAAGTISASLSGTVMGQIAQGNSRGSGLAASFGIDESLLLVGIAVTSSNPVEVSIQVRDNDTPNRPFQRKWVGQSGPKSPIYKSFRDMPLLAGPLSDAHIAIKSHTVFNTVSISLETALFKTELL